MSCVVRVRPEAVSDIDAQAEFYDSKDTGLGRRFAGAVMATIDGSFRCRSSCGHAMAT